MSKTFKKSILLIIIALAVLLLSQTYVNAVEINSAETLTAAFAGKSATIEGTTITLTEDVEFINLDAEPGVSPYDYVYLSGEDYVLDLNGNSITTLEFIVVNGSLTINDVDGSGKFNAINGLSTEEDGKLVIKNGTISSLGNLGTTTINNGTLGAITNYGTITIEDGYFSTIWQAIGTATIKGGTFISKIEEDYLSISSFNLDTSAITMTGGEFIAEGDLEYALILTSGISYIEEPAITGLIAADHKVKFDECNSIPYPPMAEGEEYYCEAFYGKTVKISPITEYEKNLIKKIAPDGENATLKTVKPENMDEYWLTNVVNKMLNEDKYHAWASPTEDANIITIEISGEGFYGIYDINVTYEEPKENTYVNSFVKGIKEFELDNFATYYQVTDLGLINYYMTSSASELWNVGAAGRVLKYSDEIIDLVDGGNIKFQLEFGMGQDDESFIYEQASGELTVFYNDYAYATKQQGIYLKRVIYIPEDTAETKEAYIQAAQERINKYLGKENIVSVTYGDTLENLENLNSEALDPSIEANTTDGNYYNITVKDVNGKERTYKFYIMKGTEEQLKEPVYQGKDRITKVEIKSTDANVPLDTTVNVTKSDDDIEEILGTDNYEAYNISLYSDAKKASVKKLENGVFTVRIPIPEKLKDKDVEVYFIDKDGKKTPHTTNIEEGFAVFETNHFSTYALAEINKMETYKVVFDANGGEFKENKKTFTIEKWENGLEETLETPTQKGYKFIGYFTEKTGGTKFELLLAEAGIYKDITFYAQWEKIEETKTENEDTKTEDTKPEDTKTENINTNNQAGKNPQTGDSIVLFAVIALISVVGILAIIKLKKHNKQ